MFKAIARIFLAPHCLLVCLLCSASLLSTATEETRLEGELIVFHAGSLSVPFAAIAQAFMQEHPKIKVLREAAGSRSCARKIADLKRPCDVFASADYTVINTLLIPDHATWNIRFVSNEMALVHTEKSRYKDILSSETWPEILCKDEVRYGRSDPNADPCGYRAVLSIKLAETFYQLPGLSQRLLTKDQRYIRPKETDLLALLETQTLDYIFLYRSVAQQHHLPYLLLPDAVNLKSPALAEAYRQASVSINGKKPGERITKYGEAMVYGLTIPKSAPNPKAALEFVDFILDPERGGKILEKNGQALLSPAPSRSYDAIPNSLKVHATRP